MGNWILKIIEKNPSGTDRNITQHEFVFTPEVKTQKLGGSGSNNDKI
jgi:hypothetical protein